MSEIIQKMKETGIIPVVTVNSAKQGVEIMKALCRAGLNAAEVTFRTEAAAQAIQEMKKVSGEALIGAGTVLTAEQVDRAIEAGADFIVSPGSTKEVIEYCLKKDILIIPGCMTPSDIQAALSMGLDVLKFFPAEAAGGIKMLKALAGPFGQVKFMPTGGITMENVGDYLAVPNVFCCGGTWITKAAAQGDYAAVEKEAKAAVELVKSRG